MVSRGTGCTMAGDRPPHRQWLVSALRMLGRPLPDAAYLRLAYWLYYRRWPDYEHPRSLQEHIQAYVLRSRDPMLVTLADKLAVREYIDATIGPGYTVPVLGAWRDAAEVPLATLAYPLVLKPTHLSGRVLFLDRHDPAQEGAQRKLLRSWLGRDHSLDSREWFYRYVPPGIIAEPLLSDEQGELPADIKASVMGGRVRYFQVDRGRVGRHTRNLYSADWELLPVRGPLPRHAPDAPPPDLPGLVALAERLAEPFEFLRVDCYLLGARVLVGELTSSPGAGFGRFFPASYAEALGAHWVPAAAGPAPAPLRPLTAGVHFRRPAP
jgi:hypothetical protein